ncbi:hypothetical protein [Nocardioides daeguensis]|uniref:hypothetical protein n=1 Tax=Nocardioides daeguensis TaxID=908359 RepID=UPI001C439D93|nr:hypothetical protein [Nocardioides daeguensis]MBV6725619.1 hypothetical protein [Nocardioides daeguensis]MCR1772866.1 hypothetical protein [Nocardioides daeguensis]
MISAMVSALFLLLLLVGLGVLTAWTHRDSLDADHGADADRAAAHRPRRPSRQPS